MWPSRSSTRAATGRARSREAAVVSGIVDESVRMGVVCLRGDGVALRGDDVDQVRQ